MALYIIYQGGRTSALSIWTWIKILILCRNIFKKNVFLEFSLINNIFDNTCNTIEETFSSTVAQLVERLTGDRRVASSRLTGVTMLCP